MLKMYVESYLLSFAMIKISPTSTNHSTFKNNLFVSAFKKTPPGYGHSHLFSLLQFVLYGAVSGVISHREIELRGRNYFLHGRQ